MKRNKIFRSLAFTAILTTSGCSLVGPKCQRLKLSEIFNVKDKNIVLVEYDEDGTCRPTLAGFQELYNLKYKTQTKLTFGITNSVSGLLSQNIINSSMMRLKMRLNLIN